MTDADSARTDDATVAHPLARPWLTSTTPTSRTGRDLDHGANIAEAHVPCRSATSAAIPKGIR